MQYREKILVADDSIFMRKILIDAVKGAGFMNIIEAEDGRQVLEIYGKEKPDIVLLDLIMPEVDGLDVLKKLIDFNAKVIVVSAVGQEAVIRQAFGIGARGYFIKPFFIHEKIEERIKTVLSGKKFFITDIEKAEIREFESAAKKGLKKAAESFKKILKESVKISAAKIRIADPFEEIERIKKKGAGGIVVMSGLPTGVPGISMLLLSFGEAKKLISLLTHQKTKDIQLLTGNIERSSLEETMNILVNSYMSVFGWFDRETFRNSVPRIVDINEFDVFSAKFLKSKEIPRPQKTIVFKTILNIVKQKITLDFSFIFREEILKEKLGSRKIFL